MSQVFSAGGQTETAWKQLDPYAQLVKQLLPRAAGLRVFDASATLRWSSEAGTGPDLPQLVEEYTADALADTKALGTLTFDSEKLPVYLWWMRDDNGQLLATVAVTTRRLVEGEQQSFSFVNAMVRPALEVLRRELASQSSLLHLHQSLSARDKDVELLLSVSDRAAGEDGDQADDLKLLLQNAADHLHCELAALIIPEKSIAMMRAGEGRTPDGSLLARTHRQLLSMAQVRREPVIINRITQAGEAEGGAAAVPLPYRIVACPVRHPSGRVAGVLALFRSDKRAAFEERDARLADLLARKAASVIESNYDSLSGLLTRPVLERRVRAALQEAARFSAWSALYIDSDQLHVINENFGMHVGDNVIAQIGDLIRRRLPPGGLAARISGDRFAVLLPMATNEASAFAEQLRLGAEQLGTLQGNARLHVSITCGVAPLEKDGEDLVHALAEAESACKAGKDRGRNRVELYQDADLSIIRRFTDITTAGELREAIASDRMRLDAQMILPLGTDPDHATPHFELLLRMVGLDGETVGPSRFLSAAQRYQFMPTIDRWVLDTAIAKLLPHAELLANRPVVFSINFSGQSLGDDTFPDYLLKRIETCGLNPEIFCFELTESDAVANIAKAELLMRRLRKLGCGVALDDFGTGLSSLSYLRSMPITLLKIDGSFVKDILKDPRSESMVAAIAQLARTMGLATVAEYVETDEIRSRIATLGVDFGQGFAIGKPMPLPQLLDELPIYAGASQVFRSVEDIIGAQPSASAH